MAMTKNIRATMNAISKLYALITETQQCMDAVQSAKSVRESIAASKDLTNYSKRVDRMCAKFSIDREMVEKMYLGSESREDIFALYMMTDISLSFNIYNVVASDENEESSETILDDDSEM